MPFSADPTGQTDSSNAFQAALNAISALGAGVLFIPTGSYALAKPLICGGCSITVRGDGQESSVLLAQHTGIVLTITCNSPYQSVAVRDIGFSPVPPGGGPAGAALSLNFPGGTKAWQACLIEDVDLGSAAPGYTSFTVGMLFTNTWRSTIRNVNWHSNIGTVRGSAFAVLNGGTIDTRFSNCSMDSVDVGFELNNYAEGLHIIDSVIIANRGVVTAPGGTSFSGNGITLGFVNLLGLYISSSEFNCVGPALSVHYVDTGWITNTHFGSGAAQGAVSVLGSSVLFSSCTISGRFNPAQPTPFVGIVTGSINGWSTNATCIDNCLFTNLCTGIVYGPGTFDTSATGIRMLSPVSGSLENTPVAYGKCVSQPVLDQSGNSSNTAQWISSTSGSAQRTTKYHYSGG